MYSPRIDRHTPRLYRLSRAVGKPMTQVADDLMSFGFKCLRAIYDDLDDAKIAKILRIGDEVRSEEPRQGDR